MIICYFGPAGTSDYRAIDLLSTISDPEPLPMSSVGEIIQTVNFMPGCLGIIPLEDSTNGELTTILDKLIFDSTSLLIQEEVVLVEEISAFGIDRNAQINTVISHPLILDLCSQFIKERGLKVQHSLSTAQACQMVAQQHDSRMIALAPPRVGTGAGLHALDNQVMDARDIRTRYLLIGHDISEPTGDDKTSLVLTPSLDRVGFLADISSCFARNNVNMTSILSRPLQAKLGNYAFHITCVGHIYDDPVQAVFQELIDSGSSIKFLGSFPRWQGTEVTTPSALLPRGSIDSTSSSDDRLKYLPPELSEF